MSARKVCRFCEASSDDPRDNLHCVADSRPHPWHRCGDIRTDVAGSDCPERVA